MPLDWKIANIVPIHKGGDKETIKVLTSIITNIVAIICEKNCEGQIVAVFGRETL